MFLLELHCSMKTCYMVCLYLIKALLNANKNRYMVVLFTLLKYCILQMAVCWVVRRHEVHHIQYSCYVRQKSRLSAIDKYVHQCGFINHIDNNRSLRKQICCLQNFFLKFNATNPPFTLGLRVKGDKRAAHSQTASEKHETIFFSDHNRKSVWLYL